MKSMQRKVGKFQKRSENEADVQSVLAEFKAVDEMLDRLIKDLKAWKNGWEDILKLQYDASEAFANLYKPIEAAGEDAQPRLQPQQTAANNMQKCLGLQKEYSDERTDLTQEVNMIQHKLLRPAEEAKQSTKLLHKTLKHRENMKLDYERYTKSAESARQKNNLSAKDEMALQKTEANLAQAQISYQTADDQVRQTFPPVSAAVLSMLPNLLAIQVMLQTTLVGQLYTVLDAYTRKFGFPNPAPPDNQIISAWDENFSSLRRELEGGISVVANGKAVHMGMALPAEKDKSTMTGLGIRNKVMHRKPSEPKLSMPHRPSGGSQQLAITGGEQADDEAPPPKPPRPGGMRSPSMPSPGGMPSPSINFSNKPNLSRLGSNPTPTPSNGMYDHKPPAPYDYRPTALIPGYPTPASEQGAGGVTPPSRYMTPSPNPMVSPMPGPGGVDYFGNRRPSQASSIASSAASAVAAKKKPPPPVPAKRIPSQPMQYVTALFDFEGQSAGDLAFKEGDRIRVVKKTDSQDDWWDGELRGRTGAFPANYVQL